MFNVTEIAFNGLRNIIATVDTFEAAKAHVEALGVVMIEDDADYAGCADAFLTDGRVVAVQPVGFTL